MRFWLSQNKSMFSEILERKVIKKIKPIQNFNAFLFQHYPAIKQGIVIHSTKTYSIYQIIELRTKKL